MAMNTINRIPFYIMAGLIVIGIILAAIGFVTHIYPMLGLGFTLIVLGALVNGMMYAVRMLRARLGI